MGASVSVVDLRKTKVTKIGSRAFAKCIELVKVYIPETVTDIHPRAFEDSLNVTIYCYEGSYADRYAQEHSIPVNYL